MILRALFFLSVILLQACATSTNLKPSGEIELAESNDVIIERIVRQANFCWSKEFSFSQDAVRVDHRGYSIYVSRWAPDLVGTEHTKPMFYLRVMGNDTDATVIMSEGECGALCTDDSYSDDVRRWMSGDMDCKAPVKN